MAHIHVTSKQGAQAAEPVWTGPVGVVSVEQVMYDATFYAMEFGATPVAPPTVIPGLAMVTLEHPDYAPVTVSAWVCSCGSTAPDPAELDH